jgi:hypothetical protein
MPIYILFYNIYYKTLYYTITGLYKVFLGLDSRYVICNQFFCHYF